MNTLRLLLIALLLAAAPAWAKSTRKRTPKPAPARTAPQPPAPVDSQPPASAEPQKPASAASPPKAGDAPRQETAQEPSLDFDLLDSPVDATAAVQVDPELEAKVARRRTMLKLHQGLGFGMAAGLVATTVVGQLHFNDRYRGGGDSGRYRVLHRGLVIGTSTLFTSVGLLGLLSPEPYEKKGLRLDTATVHKLFMSLATAGMLTQVVLGLVTRSQEGNLSQVNLATAHQAAGYATIGAVSAGVITLFF
jgi:hypothetical protein